MFLLETERIQGKISEDDYLEQKTAFETMMRRALPPACFSSFSE